jgi:hypothetical protein
MASYHDPRENIRAFIVMLVIIVGVLVWGDDVGRVFFGMP